MTEERLEDTIYNCLDFCLLNGRTPHFYLGGPDPIRHPALWTVLELLREENVSFSLLSEPEKTEYEQNRYPVSEENRIEIACDGLTCQVIYNQYLLLRNFLAGLDGVDSSVVEAATGMGMTHMQILWKVQIPLSRKAQIAGLRIALVSTVGIATIAASINAGGLGTILFDGLRTMNTAKILWGSLLSAALAVAIDRLLLLVERKNENSA